MPLFDIEQPLPGAPTLRSIQQVMNQNRRSPVSTAVPPLLFGTNKAPYVQKLELKMIDATHPALHWEEPDPRNVSHYNVFIRYADSSQWVFAIRVEHSPADFRAPVTGDARMVVQTVMRNGYTSALEDSPSVTGALTVPP